MKKLLGTTLAVALLVPGPASAEILKNLKVSGSLDIQTTASRNAHDFTTRGDTVGAAAITGQDRIGSVVTRLMADLKWDLLDDVHSVVTLRKNDRAWGGTGNLGTAQGAAGGQSVNGVAATGVLGNVYLDRANVTIDKLFSHVDTTLGRQFYGDAGDLVFYMGPKDHYGLYVTAIDAARFDMANDWMAFSGLAGKTAQSGSLAPGGGGAADTNVRGFDILWKSLPMKAHTYVWNRVIQGAGQLGVAPVNAGAAGASGMNDNLWVYGLKLRGEAMGGWLGLDLAANSGEMRNPATATACTVRGCESNSSNYMGKAFLFDAGYNAELGSLGALAPWVNFGYGSGRSSDMEARNEGFQAIASDYRPGIMNRRFSGSTLQAAQNLGNGSAAGTIATNGLNNRVVYGFGVNMTPAAWEKLTVGGQFWHYNLQRVTDTVGVIAAGTQRGAKHLGSEYGLTADWKHSENVMFGVGGSIFQPGGVVKQAIANTNTAAINTGNNPATMAFADFSIKF